MPEINPTYGKLLRQLREGAKLSMSDLSRAIEMHRAQISDVELGKRPPFGVSRSLKIARAMGLEDPVPLMVEAARARGLDAEAVRALDGERLVELLESVL